MNQVRTAWESPSERTWRKAYRFTQCTFGGRDLSLDQQLQETMWVRVCALPSPWQGSLSRQSRGARERCKRTGIELRRSCNVQVTYRWLSRTLAVPANVAKRFEHSLSMLSFRMLFAFWNKEKATANSEVWAMFLIGGTLTTGVFFLFSVPLTNPKTMLFKLVNESDLEGEPF